MRIFDERRKALLSGFIYITLGLIIITIISFTAQNSSDDLTIENSVLADSTIQSFSLTPYDVVTPSPFPNSITQATWATGLAENPNNISAGTGNGTSLTGIPLEPFANGPGGSTVMAKFKFHPWLRAAIAYSKDSVLKVSFDSRSNFRPLIANNAEFGLTDGWAMGVMQDQNLVPNTGAYGDYTDTQLHQGQFEASQAINLGKSTVNWTSYTVPVNGSVDFNKDLQVFFLVDLSSEEQNQAWKLYVRNLRLKIELQK